MFEDDQEIKKLREEWSKIPYNDKIDIFLWKMVWFHHQKHIPGNPNQAINDLTKTLGEASISSERLTKSIRVATWVAGIAATFGVFLGFISLFYEGETSKVEVRQKVFEECFDYYANINRDRGIDVTIIQTCRDKAEEWER